MSRCISCDKKISKRNVYCDNKCQMQYQYKTITKPRVELGVITERTTLKRYIKEERGHCCEQCDRDTWMGKPLPLELDHINGDASNNFPSNIQLICPNCHSITETWKGKNRGNGRKSRKLPLN